MCIRDRASPVAGLRANPDGQAEADTDALNYLQQQQQEANSAEDDVNQASAGIAPSAFHRGRIHPGDSEFSSRSGDGLPQISSYQVGEPANLTLVAWNQGSKQSSPRPQQSTPCLLYTSNFMCAVCGKCRWKCCGPALPTTCKTGSA